MDLPASVTTLTHGDTTYYVVGTAHVSQKSVDDVRTTIVAGQVLMQERQLKMLISDNILKDARAMAEQVRRAVAPPDQTNKKEK